MTSTLLKVAKLKPDITPHQISSVTKIFGLISANGWSGKGILSEIQTGSELINELEKALQAVVVVSAGFDPQNDYAEISD